MAILAQECSSQAMVSSYVIKSVIGIHIKRGRMFSNTNASTSSQSGSQNRYQIGQFSSSVERIPSKNNDNQLDLGLKTSNAKILIQNFLDNANQKNFGKRIYTQERDNSAQHTGRTLHSQNLNYKAKTPSVNLRKSYEQQSFPRFPSEDKPNL